MVLSEASTKELSFGFAGKSTAITHVVQNVRSVFRVRQYRTLYSSAKLCRGSCAAEPLLDNVVPSLSRRGCTHHDAASNGRQSRQRQCAHTQVRQVGAHCVKSCRVGDDARNGCERQKSKHRGQLRRHTTRAGARVRARFPPAVRVRRGVESSLSTYPPAQLCPWRAPCWAREGVLPRNVLAALNKRATRNLRH